MSDRETDGAMPEKIGIDNVDWRGSREFFESLGEALDKLDDHDEAYDFTWVGKRKSIIEAGAPINKTLRPDVENSKNWDTTQNLFIEGDNLDALKLLQESYLGKVKMIYIDPPYNTGKDFVYHDNFKATTEQYDEDTEYHDENGNIQFKKNEKSNGRYHSDWLSMMYPRLKLARNLLSDDGVIFISIDDNEQANLKKLCDEVFGEDNFVNKFVWVNNLKGRQIQGSGAAGTNELIYCYARNALSVREFTAGAEFLKKVMPSSYKGFDYETEEDEHGKFIATNELYNSNSAFNEQTRPNLVYDIYYREADGDIKIESVSDNHVHEGYAKIVPHANSNGSHKYHAYRWGKEKVLNESRNLKFVKNGDTFRVYTKRRDFDQTIVKDIFTDLTTSSGSQDIKPLELDKYFDFPKPVKLIEIIAKIASDKDSTLLDFFSGSATTAHAVMQLNAEDGGNRKWIMVQLPEETDEKSEAFKAGYKTIPEISRERIRRAGDKIAGEHPDAKVDYGFRALRIDDTNMKDVYRPATDVQQSMLDDLVDNVREDRNDLDLLFGVLTQAALELNRPLETVQLDGTTVYKYDYFGEVSGLVACFAPEISEATIKSIAAMRPLTAVFREASFPDSQAKVNLAEHFRIISPDTKVRVV